MILLRAELGHNVVDQDHVLSLTHYGLHIKLFHTLDMDNWEISRSFIPVQFTFVFYQNTSTEKTKNIIFGFSKIGFKG